MGTAFWPGCAFARKTIANAKGVNFVSSYGSCSIIGKKVLYLSATLLLTLWSMGCPAGNRHNSLVTFAQNGQRTLVEVSDREGRHWKIASVVAGDITAYLVFSSTGRLGVIASTFKDGRGTEHAIEYVDPAEREEALAVLDTKFLSGLTNPSGDYKKWLERNPVISYGGVQETRTVEVKQGGLGSGDLRLDGNVIVTRIAHAQCQCSGSTQCGLLPTPNQQCYDRCCDFVNCIIDVLNGVKNDCSKENSDMKLTCATVSGIE